MNDVSKEILPLTGAKGWMMAHPTRPGQVLQLVRGQFQIEAFKLSLTDKDPDLFHLSKSFFL
jgi:hypothetical protein